MIMINGKSNCLSSVEGELNLVTYNPTVSIPGDSSAIKFEPKPVDNQARIILGGVEKPAENSIMRAMSFSWAKRVKDLDRPQDELPKDLIPRSGRLRKVKDVSGDYLETSTAQSDKVATDKVTAKTTNLENSEEAKTESVTMEAKVAQMETVEKTPNRETVKDKKSRVNVDLLQKVLSESVEEWFSLSEVIKSNKGKPYKKRKIVLPPMDESDFCFELTKDTVKKPEDEDNKIGSTSGKEPETRPSEESKKENIALEINKNDKVNNTVINKQSKMTIESASFQTVDEGVKEEEDERVEKKDTDTIKECSKGDEVSENEKETTENGKNKSFRHFFALILYGDHIDGASDMMATDSEQKISSHQAKTVIKTLNLETADLKEFEVNLGDFCKLPKESSLFDCVNGIEKLLKTGATGSTLRKSLSAERLDVFPKSDKEKAKGCVEMPETLPSGQRKMNLKARECLFLLRNDIIEKYARKSEGRVNGEVQKLKENGNEKVKAEEKKKEHTEKAKEFRKKESKEMIVNKAEHKKKPKTNENVHENREKEEVNGPIDEKVETGVEKPEMKAVTNAEFTKKSKVTMKKRMDNKKANKMSAMRFKKRKQLGKAPTREKLDKLFSYINTMKRKSGYKSSSESADSLNFSNEESTPQQFERNQDTRVDETESKQETDVEEKSERRKSLREIRLTPKLVHMIATSHKRVRRSPSIREDSVEDSDYEYPNLIKKVVSGTATPEVVESPASASAIESYLQSKMEANASDVECNWQPGDLVWARFAGSPFWPSLVLRDPFGNDEYTKVKHLGRLLKPFVHLQFLADAGKRAWVPEIYCMPFNGLNEFEKIKSNLPELNAFAKRSDLVYQKAFFPTRKQAWSDAVKEGETLLEKSKHERIIYMKTKYPLVKYTESVTNEELNVKMTNGTTPDESYSVDHPYATRKRKTINSSWLELLNQPNCEKTTASEQASNKTNETFECVRPANTEDNKEGDENDGPKITLKLVRSPKKEENREWSKSLEGGQGQLAKKPKRNAQVSQDKVSNSGVTLRSQKKVGGKKEEVCEVCLRMLGRRNIIKCNGICTGVIPRGSRKKMVAKVGSSEEGAAPALKKRKRRRKFSSPRVNRWEEKLRSIFNFYKDYGGCKREGMDVRGLVSLYRFLCNNKAGNRRQSAK